MSRWIASRQNRNGWLTPIHWSHSLMNDALWQPVNQVPLTQLYRSFTAWATDAGIRNIPARNTLKANLINLGFAVRRTAEHSSVVFGLTTAFGLTTVGPSFPAWPVPGQAK